MVSEALERIGGLEGADVVPAPPASLAGYRTTLRLSSDGARPGFRRHRGHEVVPVDSCLVAHPLLASCSQNGDFGAATEVTLRCGARTGERLAVLGPSSRGRLFASPVRVIGEDELAAGRRAWIFEEVAGKRLRFSAESFFQASPEGAEVLVSLVASAVTGAPEGLLVDAYGASASSLRPLPRDVR